MSILPASVVTPEPRPGSVLFARLSSSLAGCLIAALLGAAVFTPAANAADTPPNIVLIYADDLGYGDVSCNGATELATPNIDRIAKAGVRFTDAHCSAATCTPSRFALLTGQYAFRQKGTGILRGNANLIITPGSVTLPSLLQEAGYTTAVVGKWHLGLGEGKVDWNQVVQPGPNQIGFDYHFLIPATGDRVPCVYLEQGRVVDLDPADPIQVSYGERIDPSPSGAEARETLKQDWSHGHNQTIVNGISRIGWMTGGQAARWVDEDMADVITHKAVEFIDDHKEEPFFLFFSTHDIHVPRVPHSRFAGKSGMGPRGDAIVQLDWCVGQVLDRLQQLDLDDNTLVIFSSDNGPVLDDGYEDFANEKLGDHQPSGDLRAGKYSAFEGGTRVPMVLQWPAKVPAGQVSDALFGQVDLAATLAALAGVKVPDGACGDSRNELDTLLGEDATGRPHLVHEAGALSLRMGKWKFVPPQRTRDHLGPWQRISIDPPGALYDTEADRGEQNNLAAEHPEQLEKMRDLLQQLRRK
ncbi:sulfatase family protein [Roseimaritima sediminicola]|uniref:sulfatase family protein n=1 Tax=Roseimaritima sediminicola TaxID=2662066 RepID=UPI0012983A6F|nr:arylsulfatase [Roseimaritima sediminicola]